MKVSGYVSRGAPTPVVDAARVYAFFESGDLVALDHAGKELWQRSLVKEYGKFQGNHGVGSSLAQTSRAIFVLVAHAGPSYVCAINKENGKNVWKADRKAGVSWTSPVVAKSGSRAALLISASGSLQALDAEDGLVLWSVSGIDGNTVASPTVTKEGIVLPASGRKSNLLVRSGGKGDVTDSHVVWRAEDATSSFGSPLYHRQCVYFVNRSGVAYCVDAKTGRKHWAERLPNSCWASPVAAGDHVFFFALSGETAVIKAGSKWEVVAKNKLTTKGRVYGVAAVDRHWLIRTGDSLTCIRSPQ